MDKIKPVNTISIPGGPSFDMVLVKGGTYNMGAWNTQAEDWEKPVHKVELSSFYIGKFPVVQALWKSVMNGKNPSHFKSDQRPVENVSWEDAHKFIDKLKDNTNMHFRLPTEAEWEFAARGGIYGEEYLYAGSDDLDQVGWHRDNRGNGTREVGQLRPNELGLYDMSGNVWEWCQDRYGSPTTGVHYYNECLGQGTVKNPQGPDKGAYRVDRGGSYLNSAEYCCSVFRGHDLPKDRNSSIGFRLALSLQSAGQS